MSDLLRVVERSQDDPMEVENYMAREHARRGRRRTRRPRPRGADATGGPAQTAHDLAASPTRSVTRAASKCSSSAWAYLREVPSSSRRRGERDRAVALDAARRRARARAASASGWMCMSRPRRTARPCSRSAASSAARRARRRAAARGRRRAAAASSASAAGASGDGPRRGGRRRARAPALGLRLAALEPREPGEQVARSGRGGAAPGSSTTPPPSVSGGASERMHHRSPARGTSGCSRRSWKKRPPSSASRAGASRVPWWTATARAAVRPRVRRDPGERDVDAVASRAGRRAGHDHVAARRPRRGRRPPG